MSTIISIANKERPTSIRLREQTKRMLDSVAIGKETHDEIVRRLIKTVNQMSSDGGTQIIEQGRISATNYARTHSDFTINFEKDTYEVVCTYNDLTIINMIRKNSFLKSNYHNKIPPWELNLKIVNIKKNDNGWKDPQKENPNILKTLYFACLKQILEDLFDIIIYEINTEEDLTNIDKWEDIYKRNNLSEESLDADIHRAKRNLRIE